MVLIAIYNPVSGLGSAQSFLHDQVLPLLANHSIRVHKTFATEYCGHAAKIMSGFLDDLYQGGENEIQLILLSGDGTLHEIVNCLLLPSSIPHSEVATAHRTINIVLVPGGTANALYSTLFPPLPHQPNDPAYELQSLRTLLSTSRTNLLAIAVNTLLSPSTTSTEVLSVVVTSTCLHASILHDSEQLRQEYPGLERFKIAAEKNCNRWYSGHAKVFPLTNSGTVQVFEPSIGHFVDHPDSKGENPIVELQGPFVYFLSTVNVDRLEPTYIISPSVEPIRAEKDYCNLIIIRPSQDVAGGPHAFSRRLWEILTAPYEKGRHIYLRYTDEGAITTQGQGPLVVEYFRCSGWEWYPDEADPYAHLVCVDGSIYHVPRGGRLASSVATERNGVKFAVYA